MEDEIQKTDGAGDEPSGKSKRPRSVKKVQVTVVHTDGAAALVQWVERGKLKRTIVPAESVAGGAVPADELEAGLPYGDDFGSVKGVTAAVVEMLKSYGIWTKADARANPRHVREAVMTGYVPATVAAIMEFSQED